MDKLRIVGGMPLSGSVQISGSKNASLPILCASLLFEGSLTITNVPKLRDTEFLKSILVQLGSAIEHQQSTWSIDNANIKNKAADYDLVRKMRASILILAPLLARFGEAKISLPGGCAIGNRPIDIHLKGLEAMGAIIDIEKGFVHAKCNQLQACEYTLPYPSVGATEQLLMAASQANGIVHLKSCAKEPEVLDLIAFLRCMGVKIDIVKEGHYAIYEQDKINFKQNLEYAVMPDRIEALTYLAAFIACQSQGLVENVNVDDFKQTFSAMQKMGVEFELQDNAIAVKSIANELAPLNLRTGPFPELATDAQAQLMSLCCLANGTSYVTETVFENRFMHVPELRRMGADVKVEGKTAKIKGIKQFDAAKVMASDLRASASLLIAALNAKGKSTISRVYHLDRGYENIDQKLRQLGADVERVKE